MGVLSFVGTKVAVDLISVRVEVYDGKGRTVWSDTAEWSFQKGVAFTVPMPKHIQSVMRNVSVQVFDLETAGPVKVYLDGMFLAEFPNAPDYEWQIATVSTLLPVYKAIMGTLGPLMVGALLIDLLWRMA